jgi:hypothetical protein
MRGDPDQPISWTGLDSKLRTLFVKQVGDESNARRLWDSWSKLDQGKWIHQELNALHYERISLVQAAEAAEAGEPSLFKRWSMSELLAEPDNFAWLASGLLPDPTYGQIAGEMKTLKSYVAGFVSVGIASGLPIFDRFVPPAPRPVLAYIGEGGRRLWTRRTRRICEAMGTSPNEIDVHPSFDVAPISSALFQESLRRDLDELKPGLVLLDPLYTYHGAETRASDLHQEGALLNQLSAPCMESGASLAVVNHFNQTGSGSGLKRITMAGSGEWADSWLLLGHREDPDVDNGLFRLTLEIGSRQWGGTTWNLDLDIGRFDEDTGTHDGSITWDLSRGTPKAKADPSATADRAQKRILDALADDPWSLTKTAVKGIVGGNGDVFYRAFDALADSGQIVHDMRGRTEAGTSKKRLVWSIASNPSHSDGPGSDGDAS